MSFKPRRSLVTGASSGIGEAFAHALAARGSDLVLVARRKERLDRLATQLTQAYSVRCETVEFDLSVNRPGAGLRERVRGEVDLLVNNAGFATQGPFLDGDGEEFARVIAVDVSAMVDLCHAFLAPMAQRRRGAIINVTSTTAFQPIPTLAVYSAAKAFAHSFSQSLWFEAKQHNVKVVTLAPGPTRTEFFDVIGDNAAVAGAMQSPEQVVSTGMRALDRRCSPPYVVSGRANAINARIAGLTPRRLLIPIVARMLHPMPTTPGSEDGSAAVAAVPLQ
ncbi:oxidoreductase [Mycobacterium sp. 1245111.1]|uniref:SDR family NAD(P)-dependent oxidoreductase n=1 Tax=Mycobacterium sp. 1245111.1 TaxID=1834073 RepID=UPI0007FC8343|nr:SDR family oxidoreductase [Mycobacterium sp. 1245111.1]OBK35628.1 oxidoreductase [Mycobacterium sp. 1245111.1]